MTQRKIPFNPKILLFGWLLAMGILLGGTCILAILISRNVVSEESAKYILVSIMLIASIVGTWTTIRRGGMNQALTAGVLSALIWLSLLTVNALLYQGKYNGVGVMLLLIISGCFAAVLLKRTTLNQRKRVRRYR